jgi:hypothetical protein
MTNASQVPGVPDNNAVIPTVSKCLMSDCTFNRGSLCHAKSICVGEKHQKCDTYTVSDNKIGEDATRGRVGSCRVAKCVHNRSPLCGAGSITVSGHEDHADCGMFKDRDVMENRMNN